MRSSNEIKDKHAAQVHKCKSTVAGFSPLHLKGKPQPDANLRDTENVPLDEDINSYFKREVLPHAPDSWIDHDKTKTGYEVPFNRHFYVFEPPRPLEETDAELAEVTARIQAMLTELSA